MFMQDDQVGNIIRSTSVRKLFNYVVPSIDPVRVWEDKPHLLHKT
jgi:hypothetical protein